MQYDHVTHDLISTDHPRKQWQSVSKLILFGLSILSIYALFPSESDGERFTLVTRLFSFGVLAWVACIYGEVRKKSLVWFLWFSVYFIALVVLANSPNFSPRLLNLCAIVALSALIVAFSANARGRLVFLDVINVLLVFSAVALFLQIALLLIQGNLVELHGLVFPWGSSRSAELEKFGIARLSGVHTEPGTHSAYSVGLLIVRQFLGQDIFDRIGVLVIASVAATLSFWGVLATSIYLLSYVFRLALLGDGHQRLLSSLGLLLASISLVVIFAPDYFFEDVANYFFLRAKDSSASDSSKMTAWLLGIKHVGDVAFLGLPIGTDYCNGCNSPQDAGIVLNFVLYLGLLAGFVYFSIFIVSSFRVGGIAFVPFASLFAFAKFFYFDPIVWIAFFLAISELGIYKKRL